MKETAIVLAAQWKIHCENVHDKDPSDRGEDGCEDSGPPTKIQSILPLPEAP